MYNIEVEFDGFHINESCVTIAEAFDSFADYESLKMSKQVDLIDGMTGEVLLSSSVDYDERQGMTINRWTSPTLLK